ncbi:hypothetical protein T02_14501 [Trichinella nativa]|uniref:Uncharacterized protein n=1 Tax=Trichinella nativa TaxID=6335 RepID=A0A0V1LFP9_9BILA|nr:hypothetical protein T02_14501 [Trichinella nativa]
MAQLLSQPPHTLIPTEQKSNRRQPALHGRTKTMITIFPTAHIHTLKMTSKLTIEISRNFFKTICDFQLRHTKWFVSHKQMFSMKSQIYIFTAYISHVGH